MPSRVECERDARQPVRLRVARTSGEPGGEHTEVRRLVAAAAAPLVERADRAQELRDRCARPRAQQL